MTDKIIIDQRIVDLEDIRLALASINTGDNQEYENLLISAIMKIQMAQNELQTIKLKFLDENKKRDGM